MRKRHGKPQQSEATGAGTGVRKYLWVGAAIVGVVILIVLVYPLINPPASEMDRLTVFKKHGELTFLGADGVPVRTVDVQIADDQESRRVGLMGVKELPDTRAMLFIFEEQQMLAFWMKYTRIPLDIIYTDSLGIINTIQKNTTPLAQEHYFADAPTKWVVEVQAGFTDRFGIAVGDRVSWTRL
jgi:uncharacterized membrane protein (UPF0127 family)